VRIPLKADTPALLSDARELAVVALYTDGGDYKQWYLEQVLERLSVDLPQLAAQEGKWSASTP